MRDLDITGDGTFIVSEAAGVLFNMDAKVKGKYGPSSTEKYDPALGNNEIAYWGADNLRPQNVIEEIRQSDVLRPLIHKQAKRLIGQGIVYGTTEVDPVSGEEKMKVMRVPEIDKALKRTNATLFLYESLVDYIMHGNTFPELQTDVHGAVVGLYSQDAARCRLTRKNKTTGRIEHCVMSGKWSQSAGIDAEGNLKLPALDPYYDVAGQIAASNKSRFILPIRILTGDNDYYADGIWHGLIDGGYIKLAKAIITTKLWLTINLSLIRYHVEVGEEFWPLAFPGWKDLKPEDKKKKKDDVRDSLTEWLTGQEKSGRVMITDMLIGEIKGSVGAKLGEYRSLWKITPFKLDIPTGAYVEDSAEVDAKIIRAFMDPSLFGQTPSKDRNSSGSGSDKRVAHTHEVLDNAVELELIMSPFDLMAETNGWHEKYGGGQQLRFWTKTYHAATLDRTLGAIAKDQGKQKPPSE
jgi:hypothetical protein